MSSVVAARLEDNEVREIEALAKQTHLDKSTLIKTLFRTGKDEFKLKLGMEKYRRNEVSLGKAAELAGLSILDFLSKMKDYGVTLNYDVFEAEKDIDFVKRRRIGRSI